MRQFPRARRPLGLPAGGRVGPRRRAVARRSRPALAGPRGGLQRESNGAASTGDQVEPDVRGTSDAPIPADTAPADGHLRASTATAS
ncbi:MAG: hypothetical protein M5U09_18885 [Gammaproteobacteria bacterium]|nr:hypothetical protein [Gammaproteobacteria bacterium]